MNDSKDAVSQYLQRLAEGLEALGPAETSEVLSEINSHLTDAIEESTGNEAAALAKFGSPDDFAARILEERGILSVASPVPEAPPRLRVAALAIDIAVWLVACMFVVALLVPIVFVGTRAFTGDTESSINGIEILLSLLTAGALGWLWFGKRRRRRFSSIGMEVMGLRTIRVGRGTRIVRTRHIPWAVQGKWSRVGSLVSLAVILLILVAALVTLVSSAVGNRGNDREAAALNAVTYSATGVSMIGEVYREVMVGERAEIITGGFAPSSGNALPDLLDRHAKGKIASYSISGVSLTGKNLTALSKSALTDEAGVLVTVAEYPPESDQPAMYRYLVNLVWTYKTQNGAGGQWLIQSVEPVS